MKNQHEATTIMTYYIDSTASISITMNYVICLYGMAVFIAVVAPGSVLPEDDYKTYCFEEEMASRSPTYNEDCASDY